MTVTDVRTGFIAQRQPLADALALASRVAPALGAAHLEVRGDTLTVTGTDLDVTARATISVQGGGNGVSCVPAKLAAEVVRSMEGDIRFLDGGPTGEALLSAGRAKFGLRTLPPQDFPALPSIPEVGVTVERAGLAEALAQVVIAVSRDDSRRILNGVLVSAEGEGLRLAATDSYRLAVRDLAGSKEFVGDRHLLVPGRALSELLRILGTEGTVTVYSGEHDITFEVGNVYLTSRLIEGEFPNYRHLIPAVTPNVLTADKAPLADAIKRVKLLARDATTPVRFKLESGGLFGMKVVAADVGEGAEEVDATYDGVPLEIAFNPAYLLDGIDAVPGDVVVIHMVDGLKPAVLRGVDAPEYTYLLMPVRAS